jgi:hypothetical protein
MMDKWKMLRRYLKGFAEDQLNEDGYDELLSVEEILDRMDYIDKQVTKHGNKRTTGK